MRGLFSCFSPRSSESLRGSVPQPGGRGSSGADGSTSFCFALLFIFLNSGFLNRHKKQPRDQGLSAERAGEE